MISAVVPTVKAIMYVSNIPVSKIEIYYIKISKKIKF